MTRHRLIFIDGIPGAGKTTTAGWLAERLSDSGTPAVAHLEMHEPHPVHAFWTWGDGFTDNEVVTEPYTAEKFTARLCAKADALAGQVSTEGTVAVVEAYPFQLPVRNHLKMGASRAEIADFLDRFQQAVALADPLLIYIDRPEMRSTFESAIRERGIWFEERLIGSITRSPYGRRNGLAGFEGMFAFHETYCRVVNELIGAWRFSVCRVNPMRDGWERARHEVLAAME